MQKDVVVIIKLAKQLGYNVCLSYASHYINNLPMQHHLLVAEIDEQVAGWINGQIEQTLISEGRLAISAFVVDEQHRSQGVGRLLLEAIEDLARQQGMSKIVVHSNIIREQAHRFYLRYGYVIDKQSYVFKKMI